MANASISSFAKEADALSAKAGPQAVTYEYPDVLHRLVTFVAVVVISAVVGWFAFANLLSNVAVLPVFAGLIVVAIVGVLAQRAFLRGDIAKGKLFAFAYAIVEGLFIGALSGALDAMYGDALIPQVILVTSLTFMAVVGVSSTAWGKRAGRARGLFVAVLLAYLAFSLVNLFAAVFGVGGGWGFAGLGLFGIIVCLVGCAVAAWSVLVDVTAIRDIVGKPTVPGMDWALAFSLTVSIIWLYLEILRLFARSRN